MNENTLPVAPYLYISVRRLIVLSIFSCGLYEVYWLFKNWSAVKQRQNFNVTPFLRAIFGVLFCHELFRRIHSDTELLAIQQPTFSPNRLATGWVGLIILSNILSRIPTIIGLFSPFIPSFLFLVPLQRYVNAVTQIENPEQPYYPLSSQGHIICVIWGIIVWGAGILAFFA